MQITTDTARRTIPAGTLAEQLGASPVAALAVLAHPDDESFLAGGLLAELARRGGRVVVVSATSGEHGVPDPGLDPPDQLGERREAELEDALERLGAARAVLLGIGDGACAHVPDRLGASLVASVVEREQPDVVLTFGPDGVTGHPDHRAVGRWTRHAVARWSTELPIIETANAAVWPVDGVNGLHSIDAFWPGFPQRTGPSPDVVIGLDDDLIDVKLAALACHASQMPRVETALGTERFRRLAAIEAYAAANHAARARLAATPTRLAA